MRNDKVETSKLEKTIKVNTASDIAEEEIQKLEKRAFNNE